MKHSISLVAILIAATLSGCSDSSTSTSDSGSIAPIAPIVVDPVDPVEPDPVDPVDPDPVDPIVIVDPVEPDPVDPIVVDPDPVDPIVVDPVEPDPVDPEPPVVVDPPEVRDLTIVRAAEFVWQNWSGINPYSRLGDFRNSNSAGPDCGVQSQFGNSQDKIISVSIYGDYESEANEELIRCAFELTSEKVYSDVASAITTQASKDAFRDYLQTGWRDPGSSDQPVIQLSIEKYEAAAGTHLQGSCFSVNVGPQGYCDGTAEDFYYGYTSAIRNNHTMDGTWELDQSRWAHLNLDYGRSYYWRIVQETESTTLSSDMSIFFDQDWKSRAQRMAATMELAMCHIVPASDLVASHPCASVSGDERYRWNSIPFATLGADHYTNMTSKGPIHKAMSSYYSSQEAVEAATNPESVNHPDAWAW